MARASVDAAGVILNFGKVRSLKKWQAPKSWYLVPLRRQLVVATPFITIASHLRSRHVEFKTFLQRFLCCPQSVHLESRTLLARSP